MTSIRHNPSTEDRYLAAARDSILAVGWRRSTLTDVAKRAGVSRMTVYRRWADMEALLGDLLVREWEGLVGDVLARHTDQVSDPGRIAEAAVACVQGIRENPLFRKIVEVDPELLLPYLLERPGRNQEMVVTVLAEAIRRGQRAGTVRSGDARALSTALLLTLQGFVLSGRTVTGRGRPALATVDDQLHDLIERYLAP